MPKQHAGIVRRKERCVDVSHFSKHWPCLFPQHGPGRKHNRSIRLEPWQEAIVYEETEEFVEWASHYDAGDREGRSLAKHQAWLAALPCPVLRLDGSRPLPELVADVRAAIDA